MATDTTNHGRSADDILEAGAGGVYHRAIYIAELDSASYGVEEEFAYDEDEVAVELVRLVRDLRAHLSRLSITEDAALTLDRTCPACGGDGKDWRLQEPERSQNPCEDCEGTGSLPLRETGDTK